MTLEDENVAFVVCHPAHLLTVAGMVMRLRPHILTLTKTDIGAGARQGELIQNVLSMMGLSDRLTSLNIDEDETYRQLLDGEYEELLSWPGQIKDWLDKVSPTVVIGDAYEASNIQHDIGSMMLDEALKECSAEGKSIERLEIPLLNRRFDDEDMTLHFGMFSTGSFEEFHLNESEVQLKKEAVKLARQFDPQVELLSPVFPSPETEVYRKVDAGRDYSLPPEDLALFYDLWGSMQMESGKYEKVILFGEHFLPLVGKVEGL